MKKLDTTLLFTLFLILGRIHAQVSLTNFATGFTRPCDITNCGDDRLFVVEQGGKIWILDKNGVKLATPFLDIDPKVGSNGNEQGLLGLAFDPDYGHNGYFYVNYTDNNGDTKISRFSVSANNPNVATSTSELILLEAAQPYSNHNGGCLKFGPDGYLYIGLGDGGSGGDPQGNGQNRNTFLGKMLRIAVDNPTVPYYVPPSNPFVNDPTTLDEIWAIGLRNPWRFSFDRLTGDLWIGDVGQDSWEEVDFQPASSTGGENYGWRCYEGNHTFNTSTNCPNANALTFPVAEYANSGALGCSMTGGFVYRGFSYPDLYGKYIYTDYCTGLLWTLEPDGVGGWTNVQDANLVNNQLVSFGENKNGELFALGNGNGIVYRVRYSGDDWTYQTTSNNLQCPGANDGSIQITFPANTPTPTVAWTDGAIGATRTSLAAGTYTAAITGVNGAFALETFVIAPTTMSFSGNAMAATCPNANDGSIDLTLTGTSLPISIAWSDGNTTDFDRTGLAAGQYSVTVSTAEGCVFEETFEIGVTNPVFLVSNVYDVNCPGGADGEIDLSLANPPIAVLWSDGSTDFDRMQLAVGDYSVTITTEEGCIISDTFNIGIYANVSLSGDVTDVSCANGTDGAIDVTVSGTFAPFDGIIWNDGSHDLDRTGLSAGQYSVVIFTAENCVLKDTFEVGISNTISLSSTVTDLTCSNLADGSIDLTLEGTATPPVAVVWSDGNTDLDRTGLAAGQYAVTVTSAEGCTVEETFEVGVSSAISLSSVVNDIPCSIAADGSIDLTLNGTTELPASVNWSDGNTDLDRTGLAGGQYSVTVTTSEGCIFEENFEISVAALLTLTADVTPVPCDDASTGSIDVTFGGTPEPPAAVLWSDGNTSLNRTGLFAGDYTVTVTSAAGCTVSETFTVSVADLLSLTAAITDVPCTEASNGSIDLTLVGTTNPPASIIWGNNSTSAHLTDLAAGAYNVTVTTAEGCVLAKTFEVKVADVLSLTGTTTDVPCAEASNGSIDLTIGGGITTPVSVTWNDGNTLLDRTGLAAGEYTVTVTTTEGCTLAGTFEIGITPTISLSGVATDVPCTDGNNGSIDLTLSGADVPPATVIWSDGGVTLDRTGLTAGEYTVTVTSAEGCVLEETFEIVSTGTVSLTGVTTDVPCANIADGYIDLTISGTSTSPTSVIWSDGSTTLDRTGLSVGEYTVTITSAEGCVLTETFEIVSTDEISMTGAVTNLTCSGDADGSIDLALNGTILPSFSFIWSDGNASFDRTGLVAGQYSVTVTTGEGCVFTQNFTVESQFASPTPSISQQSGSNLVLVVNGGPFLSYQWFRDNQPINGATGTTYDVFAGGITEGNYTVEVTDANGCTGLSNSLYIEWTATNAIPELQAVSVTPNPFSQQLRLAVTVSEPLSLQMMLKDLQGKTVFTEQLNVASTTVHSFDFGYLPAGTYLLILKNDKGEWVERLVKL